MDEIEYRLRLKGGIDIEAVIAASSESGRHSRGNQ